MQIERQHPALAGQVTAPVVALVLADAWRPDAGLTTAGGLDLDVAAVRAMTEAHSTGERTMAAVLLSLWGERPVDLSTLDALDRPTRQLLAEALALHAG
jgi:ribosomal protein S12 methylthiotransferase accessory factor YcaO